MTMTQRYAGALMRHAIKWDKLEMPVQAECARQAARHMEELQAAKDSLACPWQPMKTAPKDGTAVLVLLDSSDVPQGVRWLTADNERATAGDGWYMTWDDYAVSGHDGPRFWMWCPDDPDAAL